MSRRQYILDTAVRDLRLGEVPHESWQELKPIAQQFSLENNELQHVLAFYAEQPEARNEATAQHIFHENDKDESKSVDWEKIFIGLNLTTSTGISSAIERFDVTPPPRDPTAFWKEIFRRVAEGDASDFLQAIVDAESADSYDVRAALTIFPNDWRIKASVMREWPKVLKSIARRFASEFTNRYTLKYFLAVCRRENSDGLPTDKKAFVLTIQ